MLNKRSEKHSLYFSVLILNTFLSFSFVSELSHVSQADLELLGLNDASTQANRNVATSGSVLCFLLEIDT